MLSVRKVEPNSQALSTNRHIMQGLLDMTVQPTWDPSAKTLSGTSRVIGGETYEVVIAPNGRIPGTATSTSATASLVPLEGTELLALRLNAGETGEVARSVSFP